MKGFYKIFFILPLVFSSTATAKTLAQFESEGMKVRAELVYEGLQVPWGFDFISENQMILSERRGKIFLLNLATGKLSSIQGVPPVAARGQGGLLDIQLHPEFAKNRLVYMAYSHPLKNKATTRIARAKLEDLELKNLEVLFTAEPYFEAGNHFGSRITFDSKGFVYFSVGDRTERKLAQSLETHNGKILRLHEDGRIPKDNPFVDHENAKPEIWSYGHRNPQGLKFDLQTGLLWSHEHGPRGGDELNLIQKGKNYGWPVITYGREYFGPKIGEGTHKAGMEQAVKVYTPSIAPCGFEIYSGREFPSWKGNFFIGALALTYLNRLVIQNQKAVKEERLLENLKERIRNVRQSPSGILYISTDSGKIIRLRNDSKTPPP